MTVRWVMDGMKEPEEELADLMIAAMPEDIAKLYKKVGIL